MFFVAPSIIPLSPAKAVRSTAFRGAQLRDGFRKRVNRRRAARILRMELPGVSERSLKVLVVGSGGREHALAWSLEDSEYVSEVFVAPGNAGTVGARITRLPDVNPENVDSVVEVAIENQIDLVVIGPEVILVAGIVDALKKVGIRTFGPCAVAAQLEGSKKYSKEFMAKYEIPTAKYESFTDAEAARVYLREQGVPIVIKADGLAAGKGVVVAQTMEEALEAVDESLEKGKFGAAGNTIVIEEFLQGEEVSFFAVCDGTHAIAMASAQDHKAAYDGDVGPNTGGMGAYSPAPICDSALTRRIMSEIVGPTVLGMQEEGAEYRGVLFLGLMVDSAGDFKLLEYNVRFGDPECQVLCTRMQSDICELLYRAADGGLSAPPGGFKVHWSDQKAVVVVMASDGYPGSYEKGQSIAGFQHAEELQGLKVFHAGTKSTSEGGVVSDGGRVLGVTAIGDSIVEARKVAYEGVRRIQWKNPMYRKDIGWRAVKREEEALIRAE